MRVDVECVKMLQAVRSKVNRNKLKDIEFYEHGEPLEITNELIEDFELTGLNNTDFILSNYYKKPIKK